MKSYSLTRDFWPNPEGKVPPKALELKFLQSRGKNTLKLIHKKRYGQPEVSHTNVNNYLVITWQDNDKK